VTYVSLCEPETLPSSQDLEDSPTLGDAQHLHSHGERKGSRRQIDGI
jgi:hypothetical protein